MAHFCGIAINPCRLLSSYINLPQALAVIYIYSLEMISPVGGSGVNRQKQKDYI